MSDDKSKDTGEAISTVAKDGDLARSSSLALGVGEPLDLPVIGGDQSETEREYRVRQAATDTRRVITVAMPKGWVRALLSGAEAALLGWAVPALLAVFGLLDLSSNPWLQALDLSSAASLGTDFWALALGAPIVIEGLPISLMPLLWTACMILILRGLLVPGKQNSPSAHWFAVLSYVVCAIAIAAGAPGPRVLPQVILGAAVVSGIAAFWAVLSHTSVYPKWTRKLPWFWRGLKFGGWWMVATVLASVVVVSVLAFAQRGELSAATATLGAAGFGAVLLSLVQFAYLPTFCAWALAWFSGAGFVLVQGQPVSPTDSFADPALLLPVSQLLPETAPGQAVVWVLIALGVGLGALTAWLGRRQPIAFFAASLAVAVLSFSLMVGSWMALASGALGQLRLERVGPQPTAWPLLVLEIAVVAAVVALACHPATFAAIVGSVHQIRSAVDHPSTEVTDLAAGEDRATVDEALADTPVDEGDTAGVNEAGEVTDDRQ